MKVIEIIGKQEQLDEINLKQAAAAGIVGASLLAPKLAHKEPPTPHTIVQQKPTPAKQKSYELKAQRDAEQAKREQTMVDNIVNKYKTKPEVAKRIVDIAHKYESPDFPKAVDLLTLIGIESSFNPKAVSNLKNDPAVGLMQVRPGMWGIEPEEIDSIEEQIKHGAHVLKTYYTKLGDKESAIKAYNIGLRGFRNSLNPDAADRYYAKYSDEYNNMYATL